MTALENYIGIVMLLFLLSMICERVADFLKHYFGEANNPVARRLKQILGIGNLLDKGPIDSEEEDKRYFRILKLNIICGSLLALALHADLFSIIKNHKDISKTLSWDNVCLIFGVPKDGSNDQNVFLFLLGCLCTGAFISFGSKFWHDMLDLLLEVKNLKRKASDPRTFQSPENIKQFDEFINTPENKLALLAHEKFQDDIGAVKGVISVGPGYLDSPGGKVGCLEVHFDSATNMDQVKDNYQVILSSGLPVTIPVHKIVTGTASIHANVFGAGMVLGNTTGGNGTGSAGCVVKKKNPAPNEKDLRYVLSCYHVLNGNTDLSLAPSKDNNTIFFQHNGQQLSLGKVVEGKRTETMDAGLALITNTDRPFTNSLIFSPQTTRRVTSQDVVADTAVAVFGAETDMELRGIIYNDTWNQKLKYKDHPSWELQDLFVITNRIGKTLKPLSQPGDSGSLVVDRKTNEALGMVVGGDDCFTYVIKMTAIEKYLDISLA